MATAAPDEHPLKRSSSYESLPPHMSELRVVLLGNSWSKRREVGNFILRQTVFDKEPDCSLRISGTLENKEISVINTQDLSFSKVDGLTEFVKHCVSLSDPGPHVFLLVLQPENFTEEHKRILWRVLENFSDRSFNHSMVLILPPTVESSFENYMENPALKDLIRKCRYRYLKQNNLDHEELLTRMGQVVKENNGQNVYYELFEETTEDTTSTSTGDHQSPKQSKTQTSIVAAVTAAGLHEQLTPQSSGSRTMSCSPSVAVSAFRIVLLGKSEDKKTKLGNFIVQGQGLHNPWPFSSTKQCVSTCGEWEGKPVTVVKTPNMFGLSVEAVREEMKNCVTLCSPGPNVLLLLVKPSDFTEENRKTLKFILSLFDQDAFKYSMVVITHEEDETSFYVKCLIRECEGRNYNMFENDHNQLMRKIENIVHENRGTFLKLTEETKRPKSEPIKPALNLVLCGRRGAGKTSAAKTILGQTELHSVSNSSECVKNQGEVCGRWVSLVELPALYGKPQETVMEESFRCISLCDPE
uniref:AIG1-type G domain-containing protein n=3 Tax=Anabas testudineus TaxID=64144 RepID=A0AAQ6IBV9_ANATE